jgi:hypothetical protein
MDTKITLSQAIRELRTQIEESAKGGQGATIRFVPKSVEVELSIEFSVEKEASGGVKLFSLIDLSGKAGSTSSSAHKVTLTLEPVGADGKPALIRDSEREE